MIVKSTNISTATNITWEDKTVQTGIFKSPITTAIQLGIEDVVGDHVVDRKVHGGKDKACYLYSTDHYPHWQNLYPNLEWQYGMFGENLSIEELNEQNCHIGSIYRVGSATIQISGPRQPCFKLGVKFNDMGILKTFVNDLRCGTYVRVLEPGEVQVGDTFELMETGEEFTVAEVFAMLFHSGPHPKLEKARESKLLAEGWVNELRQKHS